MPSSPRAANPARSTSTSARPASSGRAVSRPASAQAPAAQSPQPIAAQSPTPTTFDALGVPAALVAILAGQGIDSPFPIQVATLPDSLAGRDVLGRGRTGSGKTLAFAIPLVAALTGARSQPRSPRGLVLVPTRELALQVDATIAPLATAAGLRTRTIFGGVGQNPQVTALRAGVDIIVATPGRLADLINQGHVNLGAIAVTVIDEADHMADLGFLPEVRRLLDRTPAEGQRLLFSATLDSGVDVLAKRYLHKPVTHQVDSAESPVPDMTHHVLTVDAAERGRIVEELLSGHGRSLAFARTKHQARRWARTLSAAGISAVDLHGNLSQAARQRNLSAFSDGHARVLVATDIAARGIHVDDVALVVHIDPPAEHKAYLHRSGRTARAGASGVVVTIATPDQRRDVADLMRRAAISPALRTVRSGDPLIAELVGPSAPRVVVAPAASADDARGGRSGSGGSGSGRTASGRTGSGRSQSSQGSGKAGRGSAAAGRAGGGSRGGSGSGSSRSTSSTGSRSAAEGGASRSSRSSGGAASAPVWSSTTGQPAGTGSLAGTGGSASTPARRGPRRATRPAGQAGGSPRA